MAKWQIPIVGGLLSLMSLVGCRQNTSSVSSVPPPSFDAPKLAAYRPVAPVAALPHQTPILPGPVKSTPAAPHNAMAAAASPMGWMPPVAARPWRWIIIHHSATTTGGAAAFDKMHKAKGWDELGYDFVVGNGTDTVDGLVEVGPRWTKQKYGAHAKTPDNRFNEYGIGICLVGNFDIERPTPKQMASLTRLVGYLMRTYHITPDRILGHDDTKSTKCPGRYVNIPQIRRQAMQLAGGDVAQPASGLASSGELLKDTAGH